MASLGDRALFSIIVVLIVGGVPGIVLPVLLLMPSIPRDRLPPVRIKSLNVSIDHDDDKQANWDVVFRFRNNKHYTVLFHSATALAFDDIGHISSSATVISPFVLGPKEERDVQARLELNATMVKLDNGSGGMATLNAMVVAIAGRRWVEADCNNLKVDFSSSSTNITTVAAGLIDCDIHHI